MPTPKKKVTFKGRNLYDLQWKKKTSSHHTPPHQQETKETKVIIIFELLTNMCVCECVRAWVERHENSFETNNFGFVFLQI